MKETGGPVTMTAAVVAVMTTPTMIFQVLGVLWKESEREREIKRGETKLMNY